MAAGPDGNQPFAGADHRHQLGLASLRGHGGGSVENILERCQGRACRGDQQHHRRTAKRHTSAMPHDVRPLSGCRLPP